MQSTRKKNKYQTMNHLSDIEIAQAKKLDHIKKIAEKLNVQEVDIEMYGKYKAKLPLHLIDDKPKFSVSFKNETNTHHVVCNNNEIIHNNLPNVEKILL